VFCPKCGGKLPDGSKFCSACGEKLTDASPEVQEELKVEDASVSAAPATPINIPKPDFVQFKKKVGSKKIIAIAVAAVVVIVAILGLKTLFSGSSGDNAYAYLSDGRYELITNLNKDQTIEIASSKSDSTMANLLAFSPDGKYIYYYTKYDSYSGTGSLCRAEYGKLKEETSKNDKYIEIIATNVSLGFRFLSDGSVTYENSDSTLYYFNGEEPVQIAKNVSYYFTDTSDKIVYATGDYSEGYTLYGVSLADIDNKIKLASNFAYVHSATDFENILYTKYEDDGSETLYVVGFAKEAEKLAESVSNLMQVDGKTYFTAANGVMLSLYDFVEDTHADSDAGITEPDRDDFSIPEYSYKMVYGSDLSESDFDELYTSCTKDLYWYGESTWWSYSMEDALDRNWGDDTDGIHAATKRFIDKFAGSADENGYILVTDEVKAALKEIQKYADNPEKEWQWMWLCYNKYQSGTTTDYDAYNAASDKWYEARNRISVRETLQNKENDYAVRTLYCFDKGTLTAVNETVLNARSYTGALVFNTTDLITETVKLENVSSAYDVRSLFNIDNEAENYIILTDGTSCRMSSSAAETFAEAYDNGYVTLYFTNKEVYMSEGNGALSMATISGGVVGDFSIVTDDAEVLSVDGSTLYYASGSYLNNDVTYCDLYSCNNGTSTRMARDVILNNINLYGDGVILAYTGYRSYSGFELTMINAKGETTLIGDNVTQYIRVDKSTLLYISDGDLYSYNGKEKKMVRSGIDWLWSQNSIEIDNTFGWYDYGYDYYN
jgi:hypothetical protein